MRQLLRFSEELKVPPDYGDMFFSVGGDWIMSITAEGKIRFNRDCFPELTDDEFAEVIACKLEEIRLSDLNER